MSLGLYYKNKKITIKIRSLNSDGKKWPLNHACVNLNIQMF